MTEKHFVLATAGHVDHGKSALVKALTGTDPDRLPEEKARGITIELGFAELILDWPDEQQFHIGIVDVPGHEDFVRNMIAGVGSVDLALIIVAADDGWMPQTEEHLQILTYLGVQHALIALTKSDLGNIDIITTQIRDRLRDTAFVNSQIIPTSTRIGDGIEDLKRALAMEFATLPQPRDVGKPRLFVDRAFTLRGIGTVVTGTLTGGRLRRGQAVVIQPQNFPARIRSIQSHGHDVEFTEPGMRTAINLPDAATGTSATAIKRGDVITIGDVATTAVLDVLLERSPRLHRKDPVARALKNGISVYVHHGTSRVRAKIALLEAEALGIGESAIAQLRLASPILAMLGDRFVIRDPSEQHTIAGGVVLDPDGDRANFRSAAQSEFLKKRAANIDDVDLCIRSQLARVGFVKTETLLSKSHFSQKEIASALSRLHKSGDIVLRKEIAANAAHWRDLILGATALIDQAHEQHPEQRGLELTKLRADLGVESDELFAAMISELSANGFERAEHRIARGSHRATLPPEIQQAAEKILSRLAAKPFDPPGRKELAPDRQSQKALQFLIEQGEVLELNNEIVLLRDAAEQMRSAAVDFISKHGPATASQLRQKIGTSRRVIIPFLEYLDRARVTRRVGDARQLREQNSAAVAQP
ncbi:MAG TPA: selenocysteine-specific translation elongation factor [Chthoniobacterales bacterium]|nr:selenocysteine-specific translation elongation factor [Chthoniobacterales bacterium]